MAIHNYVVPTVVTPPNSINLVALADIKDELGIDPGDSSQDNRLNRYRAQISAEIAQYCNRVFGLATYQDKIRTERSHRYGMSIRGDRDPIRVLNYPIIAVSSVTETTQLEVSTALIADTDYEANFLTGQFWRLNTRQEPRDWPDCTETIIYQAGWVLPDDTGLTTLPPDITDAALRMVRARSFARERDPYLRGETVEGIGSTQYWVATTADSAGNMSPDVQDILDNYRIRIIA